MISIKDLMIGNWVKNDLGEIQQVVEIHDDEKIMLAYNDFYSADELEPIPLTSEILEKNFQEFLPGINLMYKLKGPYCAMNEDGQWVFGLVKVDGENSARYPLVKISFVHQLQNALRLCGIEHEITL